MAGALIGGAVFLGLGGLLHASRLNSIEVVRSMKAEKTTTLASASEKLLKMPGDAPSIYVELAAKICCKNAIVREDTREKVAALKREVYKKERVEEWDNKTQKVKSRLRKLIVSQDLRSGQIGIQDVDPSLLETEVKRLEQLVERKKNELSSFGSMLSRNKYKKELEDIQQELYDKKQCRTVADVKADSIRVEDLLKDAGTTFAPRRYQHQRQYKLERDEQQQRRAVDGTHRPTPNPSEYPKHTTEGYETVTKVVPLGEELYCLGELSLNKKSNKLSFGRDPSRPFVFQYGSEDEVMRRALSQQNFMKYGSYGCFAIGAGWMAVGAYQMAVDNE
eukprot:jgi/Bigna1/90915/estExt_fgenesh1_pg.C_820094